MLSFKIGEEAELRIKRGLETIDTQSENGG